MGRRFLSLHSTLVAHAIGAPVGFALISLVYFRKFAFTTPLQTALMFLAIVAGLDLLLVAPFIERSYAMFLSFLGTWLPFALIFATVYLIGLRAAPNTAGKTRS